MIDKWETMSNEELCLEYQETRNNDLFEYFLKRNKALAFTFAKPVLAKHPEQEQDIMAALDIATWNAMLSFKSEFNCKFSTYVHWHYLLQVHLHWSEQFEIRIPRWVLDNYKINMPKVLSKGATIVTTSMDEEIKIGDDTQCLKDVIKDDNPNPEEITESNEMRKTLKKYIKLLPAREAGMIIDYFGIDDGIPKTLQILGDKHGVTRERIRQIIAKGLKKLKKYLAKGTYGDLL